MQKLKILILGNNEKENIRLAGLLGERYEVRQLSNNAKRAEICKYLPALIILFPSEENGLLPLLRLKQDTATRNIPVMIVLNSYDPSELKQAFDAGAVEYISTSFSDFLIRCRIENTLLLHTDESSMKAYAKNFVEEYYPNSEAIKAILNCVRDHCSQTIESKIGEEDGKCI